MPQKLSWFGVSRNFVQYKSQLLRFKLCGIRLSEEEEGEIFGKVCIVTGSNSGIGKYVAYELARRGAIVILACRNLNAGYEALKEINGVISAKYCGNVVLMDLDLSDLDSVRKFVENFKEKFSQLDLLVNNAGVCSYSNTLQTTKHGFELHMGVNHLGPFLLTNLLLDYLKVSKGRIVTVASTALLVSNLDLDDIMMEKDKKPTTSTGLTRKPYNNSKLANALFTKELARRLQGSGVGAVALCPGIVKTDLFRDYRGFGKLIAKMTVAMGGVSAKKVSCRQSYLNSFVNKHIAN